MYRDRNMKFYYSINANKESYDQTYLLIPTIAIIYGETKNGGQRWHLSFAWITAYFTIKF